MTPFLIKVCQILLPIDCRKKLIVLNNNSTATLMLFFWNLSFCFIVIREKKLDLASLSVSSHILNVSSSKNQKFVCKFVDVWYRYYAEFYPTYISVYSYVGPICLFLFISIAHQDFRLLIWICSPYSKNVSFLNLQKAFNFYICFYWCPKALPFVQNNRISLRLYILIIFLSHGIYKTSNPAKNEWLFSYS